MLPNSVSYRHAKPFKVLAAAPRPREKGRFRVAISDRPPSPSWDLRLSQITDKNLVAFFNARYVLGSSYVARRDTLNMFLLAESALLCRYPTTHPNHTPQLPLNPSIFIYFQSACTFIFDDHHGVTTR